MAETSVVNIEVIGLNGQILELLELNNALTQRCAGMRSQIVIKDTELSRLARELEQCRSRELAALRQANDEREEKAQTKAINGDGTEHNTVQ